MGWIDISHFSAVCSHRQTDKQTDRQTDRQQTDRQTDRQTDGRDGRTDGRTDGQTDAKPRKIDQPREGEKKETVESEIMVNGSANNVVCWLLNVPATC